MKMPHMEDEQLDRHDFGDEAACVPWRPPAYRVLCHENRVAPRQPSMPAPTAYYYNPWYQPPPPVAPHFTRPLSGYAHAPPNEYHSEYIVQVTEVDVLCGRGAPTSYHPGNKYFRQLIKEHQQVYLASKRSDKPQIASEIVDLIRERGGRFLKRSKSATTYNPGSGRFLWTEIGNEKAYEKTCQALREGAPEIRRRLTDDDRGPDDSEEDDRDGDREQITGESSSDRH